MSEQAQGPSPLMPVPQAPIPQIPAAAERLEIGITIDGKRVAVPEGATILDATQKLGIETPTLCFLETLTPVNACRVCVVELEGSRTLVPACSRKAEAGMAIHTESERVRLSRRLVLEFLASAVDVSTEALWRAAGTIRRAGRDGGAAAENRQRTLHARLLKMHPVLQVRGSLRHGCAKYVCDCGRGARLFRAHFHGV